MSHDKKQLKHDTLNCLAIIKANLDILKTEKISEETVDDMSSAIEELEQKIPLIIGL